VKLPEGTLSAEQTPNENHPATNNAKKPYVRPAVAWEDSLDIKALAAGCAKSQAQGCEVLGTISS
jgi:hypothetical protein